MAKLNVNVIRSTFQEITLHRSQTPIPSNDQLLILDNEALPDEDAIKRITPDLELNQTEHETGREDYSDEESILSVETKFPPKNSFKPEEDALSNCWHFTLMQTYK